MQQTYKKKIDFSEYDTAIFDLLSTAQCDIVEINILQRDSLRANNLLPLNQMNWLIFVIKRCECDTQSKYDKKPRKITWQNVSELIWRLKSVSLSEANISHSVDVVADSHLSQSNHNKNLINHSHVDTTWLQPLISAKRSIQKTPMEKDSGNYTNHWIFCEAIFIFQMRTFIIINSWRS